MTYTIATLKAWKAFILLSASSILMIVLMPYGGLGFVVAAIGIFAWLVSIAVQLSKYNCQSTKRYFVVFGFGVCSSIIFVLAPPSLFIIGVVCGIGFLACMLYFISTIGAQLAKAEASKKLRTNGSLLVYAWPIGVWFLQPRLRKVLIHKNA